MAIHEATSKEVPVVDLSAFTSGGDAASRHKAAEDLADKVRVNGCVGISGHGIADEELAEAFAITRRLFNLSYEEKMKAPHPDAVIPHRGYSGPGREQGAAKTASEIEDAAKRDEYAKTTDFKESYEIGSEDNKVNYNIWLPDETLPGFRSFMLQFYWKLNALSNALLEALGASLNLSEKELSSLRALHDGHENQLRLLHYPPVTSEADPSRLGAHTDWSTFTLLFQDENGGLEFEDRKTGNFISATPREGVLYMNVGNMFQRISNDLYPSSLHRVVTNSQAKPARYSIPYFVVPRPDGKIEPLATCVAGSKPAYEPITFQEYSESMFKKTNVYA